MIYIFAVLAMGMTLLGGMFALRFKDKLHLIVGFSAGAVIGVAFFDLLPESFDLAYKSGMGPTAPLYIAIGFVAYLILDRLFAMHGHDHGSDEHLHAHHSHKPVALVAHSLIDGVAIGLSFHVSAVLGGVVTIAVLAHDFSDGINTVSLALRGGNSKLATRLWLAADALAPVVGIFSTFLFTISDKTLAVVLAVFCGFFLYLGASDLIPESFHGHPTRWTTVTTLLGIVVIYLLVHFIG